MAFAGVSSWRGPFRFEDRRATIMPMYVHFLLTYQCLYECDHCFLYCGSQADGTITLAMKITAAMG